MNEGAGPENAHAIDLTNKAGLTTNLGHDTRPIIPLNGHDDKTSLKPFVARCMRTALASERQTMTPSESPHQSQQSSPQIPALRWSSAASTPRIRPTTLDIPGLTRSKVSPDGKIASRDLGSKLVIVMVGLPARGKSYITKKIVRYLNWLQHDAKIFNVGERRRLAAQKQLEQHSQKSVENEISTNPAIPSLVLPDPANLDERKASSDANADMEQSAEFFDPENKKGALIREACAMETLDELLHYILYEGGSVGILDATNSTLARRKLILERIRVKAGQELNVLFIESVCEDESLLESNMRLKLSGPDYKDKDPISSLADFKKRVQIYEKNYVPLGDYEDKNNMSYVKMIDVGRKVISHRIKGFLSAQAVYYLLNFNLAPRQIWITRHGESLDNVNGRIGGDSELSPNGRAYGKALSNFISHMRYDWECRQREKAAHTHFPPHPGDHTPPNPYVLPQGTEFLDRNFCVWSSMLKRSIETAESFDEDEFELKQMRMLDELNAGVMEGMTYAEIREKYAGEYEQRRKDKLAYRYPGAGGEGYLDVINRLRPVIVELERMTDHCLLITHRSVARVLLAYFVGLGRDEVADLDCPLGMLYSLEPKPYGVEFQAYKYNPTEEWFDSQPNFQLRRQPVH